VPVAENPSKQSRIVEARFVAAARSIHELPPPTGIEIAFAGRSNVGKSSLMNSLMGRRNLVRTSSTPGCTRQIGLFEVQCADSTRITLVDLPGYGYARRSHSERRSWAQLIEGYLLGRPTLAEVALLFDLRRGLQEEESHLMELLRSPPKVPRREVAQTIIATKLDKVPASKRKAALARVRAKTGLPVVGFTIRDPDLGLWDLLRRSTGIEPLGV